MFQNVVIGKPMVEPWELLAFDERDWRENEKTNTLFTETRWLPAVMKEAGLVKSNNEVRRNRPELMIKLDKPDFIELKWGKKFLFIIVGEELEDGYEDTPGIDEKLTVRDVFNGLTEERKQTVYGIVGKALRGESTDLTVLEGWFSPLEIEVIEMLVKEAVS